MSKTLVIAEKPSVAQDIVRALTPVAGKFDRHDEYFENARYVVTSAVGHLLEIQAPQEFEVKRGKWSFANLPVIPPYFELKPVEKTRTRLNAVVRLARRKDVAELVNACDAGREGELIFRLIEQYAGGGKGLQKPVQRLWLQSMTPQAIREGFQNLRSDAQMQPLAQAARSRSEADWLVGINGTRAMTAFNSRDGGFFLTTVGRVQTPTLSLVVEREEKIRKFVSRNYWEIHATFDARAGSYPGKWFDPQFKKNPDDPEARAERLWQQEQAHAIAQAVRGQRAQVREETKPSTQASPLLFDLTSLQREANARFGFSAKTTLALAQALYERHKALTYPRTDSRALPEDYLETARQTFAMLAASAQPHLAPFARQALDSNYVRASRRIFDNGKISDHFAIIPTTQEPPALSEAERKLYDLVARRFMAVFFPSAEYLLTTRISQVAEHHFKTEGRVLLQPGWLAIYGKEGAGESGGDSLVPVQAGEQPAVQAADAKALKTRPPARYSEATLLGAMEGAGKQVEDDELRQAMQEKGLGTPATRAAIIEGLLSEKYMLREGRELIPTAKAFQLMTLLRGLGVHELSRAELTGQWEHKLAQMEKGQLSREDFMRQIQAMTQKLVQKAKEYDRDSVPGDYATLDAPCPACAGVVKENYRRYACTGAQGQGAGCGFSFSKSPASRTFETHEAEALLRQRRLGPLQGFRSKAGWPFAAELTIVQSADDGTWRMEFDFGANAQDSGGGEAVDFSAREPLGPCPKCRAPVYEHGSNYVCAHAVATAQQPHPTCNFKSGQIILEQSVERAQMQKLLQTGSTDLLARFISKRTKRAFKAFLVWDAKEGKVNFAFEEKRGAGSARSARAAPSKTTARAAATKRPAKSTTTAKPATPKNPRKTRAASAASAASAKRPSAALAAIIGDGAVAHTEVIKKIWDYVKTHQLQDPADKRSIRADDKLRALFGKDSANMFELAGIIGRHLEHAG